MIINRLAVVDITAEDGRYFFPGSADSLDKFYDANGDGYMSTLDCIFVLNSLGQPVDEGEGEMPAERAFVNVPISENVWNGIGDRKTDECFANWDDEVIPMLTVTPNSESALLDVWAREDVRRREELESMVSNMDQPEEQEMGLESLQAGRIRSS